ncbi:MAG: hypothetical protein ABIG42_03330 [bacterium]
MNKYASLIVCGTIVSLMLFLPPASAKESYTLRLGTQDATYHYSMDERGTMNLVAEDFPLPGSSTEFRNIEMRSLSDMSIEISNYNRDLDQFDMTVLQEPGIIRMGYDFFQLPPIETFMSELMDLIGEDIPGMDMSTNPQEITLQLTPRGKLIGLDMELPDEAKLQTGFIVGMVENYLKKIIEPTFPEDPVSIGDSWVQTIHLEEIPFAELPVMNAEYTLVGVDKRGKDGPVARISYEIDWHYDFAVFQNYVLGETFEYYDGKEFEIVSFSPYMDIIAEGTWEHNIESGYTVKCKSESEMVLGVEIELKKLSGRNKGEIWSPSIEFSVFNVERMEID